MASAVAWRLFSARIRNLFMMEKASPLAVRRKVCFCDAIHEAAHPVEGVHGVRADSIDEIREAWGAGRIPVAVDPHWKLVDALAPDVVVDAMLAKKNRGTRLSEAPLVIGLGPGFFAGVDVHFVVETQRGHDLGRIFTQGRAAEDTGVPGAICGFTRERVLRAPAGGIFKTGHDIGDTVRKGEAVAGVNGNVLRASINGVIRGLLRPETPVTMGLKVGDIDPRGRIAYCYTLSDKARAVAGSVLEAVCRVYNRG
jgi:xanthine dehydrogenase accessory factor